MCVCVCVSVCVCVCVRVLAFPKPIIGFKRDLVKYRNEFSDITVLCVWKDLNVFARNFVTKLHNLFLQLCHYYYGCIPSGKLGNFP